MVVEDFIKLTKHHLLIYGDRNAFCENYCAHPIYEGFPEEIPYKFIRFEVIEIKSYNNQIALLVDIPPKNYERE